MRLEPLFELTATFKTPVSVGAAPQGERIIADLTGGSFKGEKLKGTVRASGADWAVMRSDGNLRLDVRMVLETDDGAVIYMPYRASVMVNDALQQVLEAETGETNFGDAYWITQVQFETGDERYTWLNNKMAVGEGKLAPNQVSYRVFTVEPD